MKNILNVIGAALITKKTIIKQSAYADIVSDPKPDFPVDGILITIAAIVIGTICIICALGIKSIKNKNKFK